MLYVFFCQNTDTTMIYTLSLHDALPICDVVGEEPGQPEGEVAEVRPEEERLAARRRRERLDDVGQVVVFRGVRRIVDAVCACIAAELEEERGQVVCGDGAVDPVLEQRVTHQDVEDEPRRGGADPLLGQERVQRARIVQQGIDALLAESVLFASSGVFVGAGEQAEQEPDLGAAERCAYVRQDHTTLLATAPYSRSEAGLASCLAQGSGLPFGRTPVSASP